MDYRPANQLMYVSAITSTIYPPAVKRARTCSGCLLEVVVFILTLLNCSHFFVKMTLQRI